MTRLRQDGFGGLARHSAQSGGGQVTFAPYAPGDAARIGPTREGWPPESIEPLAVRSWAFTASLAEEASLGRSLASPENAPPRRIVAVGGVAKMGWRGIGWSALASGIDARMLVQVRARMIDALAEAHAGGVVTIETEVSERFAGGHVWVRSLGFRFAGVVPGRAPGEYALRYACTADARQWPGARVRALLALTEETIAHSLSLAKGD